MNDCCDIVSKFGGPEARYVETAHWVAQVRPRQITVGSSVLILKRHVESLTALTPEECVDLGSAAREMESRLRDAFLFDKINYLMLMMVDRHLHFHVIPRYAKARMLAGREWPDAAWPKAPDVAAAVEADNRVLEAITLALRTVQETVR